MERQDRQILFDQEFLSRLEQLHVLAKRLSARGTGSRRRSHRVGDGLEFADHRDYSAGDDVRFIDWPYYARMEKLLLRMFHEHSDADVLIMLDASASMSADEAIAGAGGVETLSKFDYARRTAAALAYVAMGSLERVICLPFAQDVGTPFRTGRNRGQILEVLDFLGSLQSGGRTDLARSAKTLLHKYDPTGTVLILSDLLDSGQGLAEALSLLQGRCDAVVVHVFSPADADPALSGPTILRQAETLREVPLDITPELLESYRLRWEEYRSACERLCLSRGATYVSAATTLPFEKLVLNTLRQAGVLE